MHRPRPAPGVVDVHRVDADQGNTAIAQVDRRILGQVGMAIGVRGRRPVGVPTRMHQHGTTAQLAVAKERGVDRVDVAMVGADHDAVEIGERCGLDLRQVVAVRISMEGAIQVGTGVGHHLDLRDLEFGTGFVVLARVLAAEEVAHPRRRQPGIGHQPIFDDMAQIDVTPAARPRVEAWQSIGGSALVRFDDDALVADPCRAGHQQAHVRHDVVDQFRIADVVSRDVQAEPFAMKAAAIGELDLEVELHAMLHVSHGLPRSR